MNERYNQKYWISSSRLQDWDNGSHGLYFITICTKDKVPYFGNIIKDHSETRGIASLQPTELGEIAVSNWLSIPKYHSYVELDEFIIMPDHLHGILFINKPDKVTWQANKFGGQSKNLPSIIRGYKSSIKQYSTVNSISFCWQPRYYDRVIRNREEYDNIREYIYRNPEKWAGSNDWENLYKV